MSRRSKQWALKWCCPVKVVDEVFGGYLYFHKAPNARGKLHEETVRKLLALHMYDCARANEAMSAGAWKHAFRSSTRNSSTWRCALTRRIKCAVTARWKNTSCVNVLSHTCPQAWPGGRKSSSPMASGYSWIDTLKEVAAQQVSDQQLETARFRFPYDAPESQKKRICTGDV